MATITRVNEFITSSLVRFKLSVSSFFCGITSSTARESEMMFQGLKQSREPFHTYLKLVALRCDGNAIGFKLGVEERWKDA